MIRNRKHHAKTRKGAAIILAVALLFVLFSFLAFSIDTGYVAQSRAEITRTADAAAMAGAWEIYENLEQGYELEDAASDVRSEAASMAILNPVNKLGPVLDQADGQDIEVGYLSSLDSTTISQDSSLPYYAVRVNVMKTAQKNGEVPFFFGKIFGRSGREMDASATAVLGRSVSGFELPPGSSATLNVLPFALDETTWEDMLNGSGTDNYAYDPDTDTVSSGSDGILEVNLYPQGTGSPGNRGTVDIGASNNSTNDIKRQILSGISEDDLNDLGEPLVFDANGELTLNGDTGISAGVKSALNSIIGEKRIIPVFSSVSGNGNNANYTIVKWVGVRILYVKLTGSMKKKTLVVQPAPVLSPYSVTNTEGTEYTSDFVLTSVKLAR